MARVDLKPVAITPELAAAALASPAMSAALKLADWVGDGRDLTGSGVLRPAVAVQACAALGFDLPSGKTKLRSALDVPELVRDWELARAAGLITLSGTQARGFGFHDVTGDPAATIDAWLRGVAAPLGLPDDPCQYCLTAVALIAEASERDGGFILDDLLDDVGVVFDDGGGPCQHCGTDHAFGDDDEVVEEIEQHVLFAVANFKDFGAVSDVANRQVANRQGAHPLTPLGQMLVASVFAALAPAPEDSASAVVIRLGVLPAYTAMRYASDWLDARTPAQAARELFAFAATAVPILRGVTFALAEQLGPEAAPAYREIAGLPGYGAYARAWLADQGEDVPPFPQDAGWFVAEMFSSMLDQAPPDLVWVAVSLAIEETGAKDYASAIEKVTNSGHPDAPRIIDLLRIRAPEVPQARAVSAGPAARPWPALVPDQGKPLQLMITLRGVDDPPVWRRVAVPGSATLDELHRVIQGAMGWDNDHQYAFWADRKELPGGLSLTGVLPKRGSRLQYTYDFGDDWQHDIKSEGFFHNEQGVTLPACLDGAGACPPEDCGGAGSYEYLKADVLPNENHEEHEETLEWLGLDSGDDFDPAGFSLNEADARLARLRPH